MYFFKSIYCLPVTQIVIDSLSQGKIVTCINLLELMGSAMITSLRKTCQVTYTTTTCLCSRDCDQTLSITFFSNHATWTNQMM